VPFVSKATGLALAKVAARCMAGQSLAEQGVTAERVPPYFSVKEAVLPFAKFLGVDTILGPEMKSTGEVMGCGPTFGEAYFKALLGAGVRLPRGGQAYLRVKKGDQARAVALARELSEFGFELLASHVTALVIGAAGIAVREIADEQALAMLANKQIGLVVLTVDEKRSAIGASRAMRVATLGSGAAYFTTIAAAEAALEAMRHADDTTLLSVQDLHRQAARAQLEAHVAQAAREAIALASAAARARREPDPADLAAAATEVPERRRGTRERAVGVPPLKLFIRQPFTESDQQQQGMIADILQLIDSANGLPHPFLYLTGTEAESADTFRTSFERKQELPFTPKNFRRHRLQLLQEADVMINIRVGMSESSAFELAYHIFQGRRTPVLFLVWKGAPIKTTLLRELDDLCDVTYIEFEEVEELRSGLHRFFNSKAVKIQD
jgi:carbamoyl-phosphate synthase large subunit